VPTEASVHACATQTRAALHLLSEDHTAQARYHQLRSRELARAVASLSASGAQLSATPLQASRTAAPAAAAATDASPSRPSAVHTASGDASESSSAAALTELQRRIREAMSTSVLDGVAAVAEAEHAVAATLRGIDSAARAGSAAPQPLPLQTAPGAAVGYEVNHLLAVIERLNAEIAELLKVCAVLLR
jgi:hypothetical protein